MDIISCRWKSIGLFTKFHRIVGEGDDEVGELFHRLDVFLVIFLDRDAPGECVNVVPAFGHIADHTAGNADLPRGVNVDFEISHLPQRFIEGKNAGNDNKFIIGCQLNGLGTRAVTQFHIIHRNGHGFAGFQLPHRPGTLGDIDGFGRVEIIGTVRLGLHIFFAEIEMVHLQNKHAVEFLGEHGFAGAGAAGDEDGSDWVHYMSIT